METIENTETASIANENPPPWPANDKIWWGIVATHNKLVDAGKFTPEKPSGSKSITLVMVCAVIGMPIPMTYRLNTERKGLHTHINSVKDYLKAVSKGERPEQHGKTIESAVKHFAEKLGVSIPDVNAGLEKALKLRRVDQSSYISSNQSTASVFYYLPTQADVEAAESQLRKSQDEVVDIESVLDQVKDNLTRAGKPLKNNWRETTRRNIAIWFGKNEKGRAS